MEGRMKDDEGDFRGSPGGPADASTLAPIQIAGDVAAEAGLARPSAVGPA
jgi:hypothetical protein